MFHLWHLWPVKVHEEHEILHLLREIREEQKLQHKEIMIAQSVFDASLKGLTVAVDNAVAALAAGDTTTSTPDTVVSAYVAGVDSQALRAATATPPPVAAAPAAKPA
jgi:hypothetical protein